MKVALTVFMVAWALVSAWGEARGWNIRKYVHVKEDDDG